MVRKRIAVFDFRAADCIQTAEAVKQHFQEAGIAAEIAEFTAIKPFVNDFKEKNDAGTPYDMAFIGIDSMMGVETARNIRELDLWSPIFIVSEVSDYGMEGFRLHALDYLAKPVSPGRVGEAVRRIGMKCQAGLQSP